MSKSEHYTTSPEDRISIKQKTAYAIGMLVNNLQAAALPAMVVILNLGLGMDVILVGIIGAVPRIFDAISDPMMGYISDNTRTKWGRRRPYIFAGAIIAGIIFALMWQLPSGYIDILSEKPTAKHESLFPGRTNVIIQEGQAVINYDKDRYSESGFIFYGPKSLALEEESVQATNLSEYSSLEVNAEIPEDLFLEVIFNEAGAAPASSKVFDTLAGDDGESFSFKIVSNKLNGDVLGFNFSDLKPRTSYGNQNGKKQLDTQAIKNIVVRFPDLQGSGTIKIHSIKLKNGQNADSIDILTEDPISQHKSLSPEDSSTIFKKGGETVLNYNVEQQSDASFILHGPDSLALITGPAFATNLDGFPEVEVNIEAPKGQPLRVFFNEAGVANASSKVFDTSGGDDGESYYIDPTVAAAEEEAKKEERVFYSFNLDELQRSPSYGNQNGNNTLDMQAIKNITLSFTKLQGSETVTIHSFKLKKSESFFTRYFWYFMTMSVLFFLAYTVYATPFVAFGYEMTPDYHERTRLHAFANTVGQLAWLGVPWFYALMASNLFRDTVHGARTLAVAVGIVVALLGIVPAIFCREKFGSATKDENKKGFAKNMAEFFAGIYITFKCKPFVKLCGATFLVFNGFQLGVSFSIYVMIYYLFNGNDSMGGKLLGWFGMLTSAATLVVIPLTGWIATKIGKRRTFLITISLSLVGYALKWVGYNPEHPYWLLFAAPFVAFGTGSLFTLMGSMIADVCDYDELQTKQRREGVFGAIYWWMVKVGMALAGLLTGIMLKVSGFDVALAGGQSVKTLFLLRVFDVGVPLVTSAIAILIIVTYKLTEEKAYEIRTELEKRRGS
jgi:GPH family glycoside/pentoside/hexuronide:cation symporter